MRALSLVLRLMLLTALLALPAACRLFTQSGAAPASEVRAVDPAELDALSATQFDRDCAQVCVDAIGTRDKKLMSRCQSCRCKQAFLGYLPTAEELSCSSAATTPIVPVRRVDGKMVPLVAEGPCDNPARLDSSCATKSRLGQIKRTIGAGREEHDIYFKFICRADTSGRFYDTGIIGYNADTGATCWWDDNSYKVGDGVAPKIDLLYATDAEVTKAADTYGTTTGSGCIGCHDSDPFLYTPMLSGTRWQTSLIGVTKGPYSTVDFAQPGIFPTLVPVGDGDGATAKGHGQKHLVSERAEACTICHRIGNDGSCGYSKDSWAGVFNDRSLWTMPKLGDGSAFPLAYWMPDHNVMRTDVDWPASRAEWLETYGEAKAEVERCCAAKSDKTCWDSVPHERTMPRVETYQQARVRGVLKDEMLITPNEVMMRIDGGRPPIMLAIGAIDEMITGSVDIGDLMTPAGNKRLRAFEEEFLATTSEELGAQEVVIYCGCCPSSTCPYLIPALQVLLGRGYQNLRLIDFKEGFQTEWADRGRPLVPRRPPTRP